MQLAMGQLNLHRVDSEELEEVQSIESSNIDYVELFGEKFKEIESMQERINSRINKLIKIIDEKDASLRDLASKNK